MRLMRLFVFRPVDDDADEEKRRDEVAETLGEDYTVMLVGEE